MGFIISKLCPWLSLNKKTDEDCQSMDEEIQITDNNHYNENTDRVYKMIDGEDNLKDVDEVQINVSKLIIERQHSVYDSYELLQELGSGSYGIVWKVKYKYTGELRAMKVIRKENLLEGVNFSELKNEISVLKRLDHPNILKIYEFFQDDSKIYLITEFCSHGDLHDKIEKMKKMDEIIVKVLMYHLLVAVAYLHSNFVIHGDLKLENILIDKIDLTHRSSFKTSVTIDIEEIQRERGLSQGPRIRAKTTKTPPKTPPLSHNIFKNISKFDIKLIDFGCSRMFNRHSNKRLSGVIGTSIYCSPEVIDNKFNEKCDIWACGIIMFILLAGFPPFCGDTDEEIFNNIKNSKVSFDHPEFKEVSPEAKNLIKKLLSYDPEKRISANQALRHSFFSEDLDHFKPNENTKAVIDLSVLSNLKNCRNSLKFQQAVLAYISHNFANKDEVQKIKKVFKYLDKNSDGTISKDELLLGFKECGEDVTEETIETIIKAIDNNCNGRIEYQEFIRASLDKKALLTDTNLRLAFDLFDIDKNGVISREEVKEIIFGDQIVSDQIVTDFFAQIDKKESDPISFDEFKSLMYQIKD